MKSICRALLLTILVAPVTGSLGAQPPVQETTFGITSVKPLPNRSFMNISGGQVSLPGITVKGLLVYAYNLSSDQILDSPEWTDTEFWAIQAKPPAGTDLTQPDIIRKMVQSLLEGRFQLKAHRESKDFSVFFLGTGNNGLKLSPYHEQAAATTSVPPRRGSILRLREDPDDLTATGVTMSFLADYLGKFLDRPVLDKTGLDLEFDFKLRWLPGTPPPGGCRSAACPMLRFVGSDPLAGDENNGGVSIFTALRQVGLTLESSKAALDVLVIDSVQRPTTN